MAELAYRDWVPAACEDFVQTLAAETAARDADATAAEIDRLIAENRAIHERDCVNLNPATNAMNPKAEAALSAGLGARPSLGYPGDKYEMGLEAIERIEVIAAELAAEVFGATFAEIRVASGAMANLYMFMASAKPGDTIIVPPAAVGGHVTHHQAGAAGLYGLDIREAPVNPDGYTVDVAGLRDLARACRPKLITIGGSLNLFPHPVAEIRAVTDEVGAWLSIRRRAYVRHDRRPSLATAAGRGRPCDDHEHLQEPGRAARRPDRRYRAGTGEAAGRHRLPWPDRQLRRGQIGGAGDHAAGLEGARGGLRGADGGDGQERWPMA